MANLTSNSGTTFLPDGGNVGVEIQTNTNWKFYLRDNSGEPDWLHFNGNVSEITGTENKIVNVEAAKNKTSSERYASGICESINETNLIAWTGFYQGGGSDSEDGLRLTYVLNCRAISISVNINRLVVEIPEGRRVLDWSAPSNTGLITVHPNQTTKIVVEMKSNYSSSFVEVINATHYIINIVGGNHTKVEPGTYARCIVGFGYEEKSYNTTEVNNVQVTDEGNGSFTFIPNTYIGGDYIFVG